MSESSTHITNRLSILILQDGFSFFITNVKADPVEFEYHSLTTSQSTEELLKLIKSKITTDFSASETIEELEVIYANPQFSIVPEDYFEDTHLPHYIKYSSKLIEGDDFSYDDIPSISAKTVYIPYVNINNYLFECFGSFKFTHLFTRLVGKAHREAKNQTELVSVHVAHQHLYTVAFRNQKLILANAFGFETPEDLAYYILFCVEQLEMDRENLSLKFTGNFFDDENNLAFEILSKYIRHISFANLKPLSTYSTQKGFQEHFNLL